MPQKLFYPQVDENKIIITRDMSRGLDILWQFRNRRTEEPLYIDTEDSHHNIRGGEFAKLALLQIFDAPSRTVLLFRVHHFNEKGLEKIQRMLRNVSITRRYDDEDFFYVNTSTGQCENFQNFYEDTCLIPLKTSADAIGIFVDKQETMSDWTAPYLNIDQIMYAAYDAIVLRMLPSVDKSAKKSRCPIHCWCDWYKKKYANKETR
ncbi:hypothetical protein CAEBREN_05319 [Caenorhabditis brenneri]|uniref:3'-5' exonuclease domain-containing protein n=1 Tax=Caenorhabditis brenneri TaxID=135651 RepID=G0PAM6_CAEBE|nr:hypothetical protein CAEBREN_05319 [Caenorhabditis brenneri]